MTDAEFDEVVVDFYKAAMGEQPWGIGLGKVRHAMSAQAVNLYGAVKQTRSVAFSFEVGEARPEAALDFIREYHQIDPRAALGMSLPVGQVGSCHRHFDDEFVAQDRFYQEFLIPYGGRYSSGMKVYEDDEQAVIWGIHRPLGAQPLNDAEEALVERLGLQLQNAVTTFLAQRKVAQPASVGIELLQRMPQPLMLLDETRRIVFCNEPARGLLEAGQVLADRAGLLSGPTLADDAQLLIALRTLGLSARSYLGNGPASDKVFLRLQNSSGARLGVYLYAMRPSHTMGAFGPNGLALVMLHDPQHETRRDPFVVAATWGLTPAEAKVAVALQQGHSGAEIALAHGVSQNTVRTQIQHAMEKMGVTRQAELVGLLASLPPALS
ncbi:helix-turn-helix transcriptional regulator [uncultured Aquabacterium sp.]|uniref:helix-turn-helix transcriptional regulator n=1 Tax=uncultured Aquabacterium sp. TaxID=158753 RepID=UPI0030CA7E7A